MRSDRITEEAQNKKNTKYRGTCYIRTHTHTDEWQQLDGETKHVRTEERWGAATAVRNVCVHVLYVFVCVWKGFYPSNAPSICLNINTVSYLTGQWLWRGAVRCGAFAIKDIMRNTLDYNIITLQKLIALGTKAGRKKASVFGSSHTFCTKTLGKRYRQNRI